MPQEPITDRLTPAPAEPVPAARIARPRVRAWESIGRVWRAGRVSSQRRAGGPERRFAHGLVAALWLLALPGCSQTGASQAGTSQAGASAAATVPAPARFTPGTMPAQRSLGPLGRESLRGNAACLILPSRVAEIGSPAAAIVEAVEVDRGDAVARGAILVRLQADVERARASVSRQRADSEAELRGALAAEDLARQQYERSQALLADNFVSRQAVDQAAAEFRLASEKVAQARDALKVTVGESGVSAAQMAQRLIRAPFAGVVIERFAQPGERYEEKPLLRLAAIDELKVEVIAPNRQFGLIQLGQIATIEPDLPGHPARTARVVQVDQVLDPASNTFRVRLALPNPDRDLPAGLRCRASFEENAPKENAAEANAAQANAAR